MSKGLYIHIPFCIQKCKYCDFVSFTSGNKSEYIFALCRELSKFKGESIDTIFIGGGTPTALSKELLEQLFYHIKDTFYIEENAECSIEANPKTLDENKLKLLSQMGVNRISIGVQSFNDRELTRIGRIHNAQDAKETIKLAKKYFDNVNLDLIFGLPEQNIDSFKETLKTAISLNPSHISCYSLILEEGTVLYNEHIKTPLNIPSEDDEREMYDYAVNFLEKSGYEQYEISNFSKKGRECKHNLKYWQCEDYIGAGLSAHSLIDGVRYENTSDLKEYLSGNYCKNRLVLTDNDKISEYIIMSFRLKRGISSKTFYEKFGIDFLSCYKTELNRFIKLGLIAKTEEGFALTNNGISISNSVLCEFV